jgi:glycosyltransferase involved in cell wall biosynthesis
MSPAGSRFRISVGIAACNAEANLEALLRAVLSQSEDEVEIEKIIVHSDQSTDRTVGIAQAFSDPRIVVIDNPRRAGFAASVRALIGAFTGDAIVLLNDDIRIPDNKFVEKMASPVFRDGADLVGANMRPLPPRTFVERAFTLTCRVYERIRQSLSNPNSIFTCDGAALCLSRRMAGAIEFPRDGSCLGYSRMGNVDAFLYFLCARAGYRYLSAPPAVAWYRAPSTLHDYLARNIRNDSQNNILEQTFGPAVNAAFSIPANLYWRSVAIEGARRPLEAALVFVVGLYIRFKVRTAARNASPVWDVLPSSKRLD